MLHLLRSREGEIFISVILGFGIATLFRRVCKGRSCVVIKGPKLSEVQEYVYRIDDRCYQYKPRMVACEEAPGAAVSAAE
jgi:hypothetical protein